MIVILANSLAYYDSTDTWYDVEDLKEEEMYPRVLQRNSGSEVATYAQPWLTVKDARSRVKKIPRSSDTAVFVLHVGIVESLPRVYPIAVRKFVNRFPVRRLRHRLNEFESRLIVMTKKSGSWITPEQYGRYLEETLANARKRLNPEKIILVNVFHVGGFVESRRPGTNRNITLLNSEIERRAKELGAYYLDANSFFDDSMFLIDRVHMNAAGHAMMAKLLQEAIEDQREIKTNPAL
ncbi:MAG TPA: SGNH/GDSL hydrolase family protein [Nitrososphaerales archaeon]|nr:SGNH/GDSL hydrolase family protein [Nitrososphaerales archaeon]